MKKGIDYPGVCVVYFCHDGNGNFVMAKRSSNARDEHDKWDIGGGGVDLGDSIDKTIKKEVMEEYCTSVLDIKFLGYRDVHRTHQNTPTHWIALDFKVKIDPKTVKIGEPHKFDAIDWYTLDTIPKDVHSQFPNFLEQYRDRLISDII